MGHPITISLRSITDVNFACADMNFFWLCVITSCCGRYRWGRYGLSPIWSHLDRATIRVIEYFAKSLKITEGHSKDTVEYRMRKTLLVFYWNLEMWVRALSVIRNGTIRKLGCDFLFAFHSNYGSILHQFQDTFTTLYHSLRHKRTTPGILSK